MDFSHGVCDIYDILSEYEKLIHVFFLFVLSATLGRFKLPAGTFNLKCTLLELSIGTFLLQHSRAVNVQEQQEVLSKEKDVVDLGCVYMAF